MNECQNMLLLLTFSRHALYLGQYNKLACNKEYQRYQVVRSNTTLLFVDVEQTDYMFRHLSIRPSSGLARGTTEEELTMLPSTYNAHCPKATGKNEISFVA